MAQRNSASAKDPAAASPGAAAGESILDAPEAGRERRRAAAYLDLWERQLTHVAAQASPSEAAMRRGAKGRA